MGQMLPNGLMNYLANPGIIEDQIKAYFTNQNYKIENEKTVAGTTYYHYLPVATLTSVEFFSGVLVPAQTNVPGNNFIRPQSEHQLIYGVRLESATTVGGGDNDWTPGCIDAWGKNCTFSITSNGVIMVKDIAVSEALENLTTTDNGLITFKIPFIWGGQEELKLTMKSKGNVAGSANTFYKWTLQAVGLIS